MPSPPLPPPPIARCPQRRPQSRDALASAPTTAPLPTPSTTPTTPTASVAATPHCSTAEQPTNTDLSRSYSNADHRPPPNASSTPPYSTSPLLLRAGLDAVTPEHQAGPPPLHLLPKQWSVHLLQRASMPPQHPIPRQRCGLHVPALTESIWLEKLVLSKHQRETCTLMVLGWMLLGTRSMSYL